MDGAFTQVVPDSGASMDIAEKANAAGSYEYLGEAIFVDDIIDPGIVKKIREFVPEYVPLLTKRRYKTPAGQPIEAMYHIIGRYIENPTEYFEDATVKLEHVPHDFPFDPKKIHPLRVLWAPWAGPNDRYEGSPPDREWSVSAPPGYVKPEGWLIESMRALHHALEMKITLSTGEGALRWRPSKVWWKPWTWRSGEWVREEGELRQTSEGQRDFTIDKLNEILDKEEKREADICKKALDEARYRMKHNWAFFKAAADKEEWGPEPLDDRPRPFVDLGGK